ncbi:uncharacterized protein FTOL_13273 [Fusarium torulosum]|uniref:Uncharacterized protein n=1 Tax=Fusarium torulosum TaxID=33205 RepID=A0AAE8MNK1_9HYPO|nr:uncharacterized protein FTOL_13273 [Fusarium torulosum]
MQELPAEHIAAGMARTADPHIDHLADGNTTAGLPGVLHRA